MSEALVHFYAGDIPDSVKRVHDIVIELKKTEDDDPENIHPVLINAYGTLGMFLATRNDHKGPIWAHSSAVRECPRLPVTEDSLLNYCDLFSSYTSSALRGGLEKKRAEAIKVVVKTYRTHKEEFLYVCAVVLLRRTRYPYETDAKTRT